MSRRETNPPPARASRVTFAVLKPSSLACCYHKGGSRGFRINVVTAPNARTEKALRVPLYQDKSGRLPCPLASLPSARSAHCMPSPPCVSLPSTYPPMPAPAPAHANSISSSPTALTSFPLPSPTPHRVAYAISFFLLGLLNNVLYVVILSAALDLVGRGVPKVSFSARF